MSKKELAQSQIASVTQVGALIGQIFAHCTTKDVDQVINRVMGVHPEAAAADEPFEYQMRGVGCIDSDAIVNPEFSNASPHTVGSVRSLLSDALSADGIAQWAPGSAAIRLGNLPKSVMHEYAFDCVLEAAIRVSATSRGAAEDKLRATLDAADCNGGAWPNGDPVLFEASVNDGKLDLFEVDGETVEDANDSPAPSAAPGTPDLSTLEADVLLGELRRRGLIVSAWGFDDVTSALENDAATEPLTEEQFAQLEEKVFEKAAESLEDILTNRGNDHISDTWSIHGQKLIAVVQAQDVAPQASSSDR